MYYLKYRPKNFAELFGLEEICQSLKKSLEKGRVSHAYIFTGPKGSGKTTTARILAKAVNCERLDYHGQRLEIRGERSVRDTLASDFEPCNECDSCRAINEGRFLDLIEIDAASNRGIDDVRDLREKIKLSPAVARFKFYIIDEAHMLTPEAFNALLKTLEEPPAHAIFVLATTEYQKIPETIKSRCQILRFRRGRKEDLIKKLRLICQREGVEVGQEKLLKIASLAEGGFRDAETLLEQVVVGEVDLQKLDFSPATLVDFLIRSDRVSALEYLNHLFESGESLSFFNRSLIIYLRNLLLILGGVGTDLLEVGEDSFAVMQYQAKKLSRQKLIPLLQRFIKAEEEAKFSPLPQLPLELAIFDVIDGEDSKPNLTEDLERSLASPKASESEDKETASVETLSLKSVLAKWDSILKAVKPTNHSLEALLRSARPKEVTAEGKVPLLVVEVFYKFHQDKLSLPENVKTVQKVVGSIFGVEPNVAFILGEKKKALVTEKGSTGLASEDELVSAALEAFGA